MGMSVTPFVIKCAQKVRWDVGFPRPLHVPILIPSDFTICSVDDGVCIENVPFVHLTRQAALFEFLARFLGNNGLALPGHRRRISNTEKFIDFLCTGQPTYLDEQEEDSYCVCNPSVNFRERYLPCRDMSVLYSVDYLYNFDYDAKLVDEDVSSEYRGKSMREIFDGVTNRDYGKIIKESKAMGWDAILFSFS